MFDQTSFIGTFHNLDDKEKDPEQQRVRSAEELRTLIAERGQRKLRISGKLSDVDLSGCDLSDCHAQKAQCVDPGPDLGVKHRHRVRTCTQGVVTLARNGWQVYVGMPGNNRSEQVATFIGIPSLEASAPIIEGEQLA